MPTKWTEWTGDVALDWHSERIDPGSLCEDVSLGQPIVPERGLEIVMSEQALRGHRIDPGLGQSARVGVSEVMQTVGQPQSLHERNPVIGNGVRVEASDTPCRGCDRATRVLRSDRGSG